MKFAPVLSQKYDPGSLSDYHLILAHEVVKDTEYAQYYSQLGEEHIIILDNGTVENGSVQVGLVEEALKILNRKVVCVAPDFLGDKHNTLEASTEFLRKCDLPEDEVMVVPQGSTWEEWVECFESFEGIGGFRWVGLPRIAEEFPGDRSWIHQNAVQIHRRKFGMNRSLRFHLLGIQHTIQEVEWAKHFNKSIIGVDSSAPLKAAAASTMCGEVEDFRVLKDEVGYKKELVFKVQNRIKELVDYFDFKGVPGYGS